METSADLASFILTIYCKLILVEGTEVLVRKRSSVIFRDLKTIITGSEYIRIYGVLFIENALSNVVRVPFMTNQFLS
jgi:hypothetical protein